MGETQTTQWQVSAFDQLMWTDSSATIASENNSQQVSVIDSTMNSWESKQEVNWNSSYNTQIFNDYIAELSWQPWMSPQAKQTLIEAKAQELWLSNDDATKKTIEVSLKDDIDSLYKEVIKDDQTPESKVTEDDLSAEWDVSAEEIEQVVEYIWVLKASEEAAKAEAQNAKMELSQKDKQIQNLENKLNEKLIEISNLKYDNIQDPDEWNIVKLYRSYKDSPKASTADAIVLYFWEYLEKITWWKLSSGELFNMYKKTNTQPQNDWQRFNQGVPIPQPVNPLSNKWLNDLMNG